MNTKTQNVGTMISTMVAVTLLTAVSPAMAAKPVSLPKPQPGAVMAVFGFDGDWTQSMPNGPVYPASCQTEAYLAGPNEVAIVNMNGFLAPSGASNDYLMLKVVVSIDGWPFEQTTPYNTLDGLSDGAGHVGTSASIPLEDGATYIFAAQFLTGAPLVGGFSTCHGTALVVRLPS